MADKLTDNLLTSIPAPAKGAITVWDNDPKARGFGARVFAPTKQNPKGLRSFFINYRIDGVERRHTIGKYPLWSVSAARSEAQELRKRVDRSEDPALDKRERREAPIVGDLIDRYVRDHLPGKAAEGHRRNDEIRMLDLIANKLGKHTKVADVHYGDIEAMHRQLSEERGPVRSNRILSIASKAFSLSLKPLAGENKPWRDAAAGNPCRGIERNREEGRERYFSEAEIAALSDALNEHTAVGSAANCIRFIMLTGCRPGEAMQATWEQMDVEPGYWCKPSAHTKQRKAHKVPLSPPALVLLDALREARKTRGSNPYVFPGQVPGESLKQIWGVWYAARDRATIALWKSGKVEIANLIGNIESGLGRSPTIEECQAMADRQGMMLPTGLLGTRPYDLRHTFASVGAGGGLSLPIIGKLLGHTQSRTTQRYAHLADDPLREATNTIGAVISGAGKPSAKLLTIKG